MSPAARSVFVFGLYLLGTSALLLVAPNLLLTTLGMAPTTEPWIRVLGIVVGVLGAYYVVAARAELMPFLRMTIPARLFAFVGFGALVAMDIAQPPLAGLGLVDALGAFWTWRALRAANGAP